MSGEIREYWRTQQLALALGVSASTVKRWADAGVVRTVRTVGRHRLIPRDEALRLASRLGCNLAADEALPVGGNRGGIGGDVRDRPEIRMSLPELLPDGSPDRPASEVRETIARAYNELGPAGLADDVIRPAFERVGHDWGSGGIDVYQEHRLTRVVEQSLGSLVQLEADRARGRGGHSPLAMGANPPGDFYTLPGLLCELTMRSLGWDVMNLGAALPLVSFARAVREHRPRLAWLSVSHIEPGAESAFVEDYSAFFRSARGCGTAVILGGRALDAPLRARIVACAFGDRMAHLVEFARLVCHAQVPSDGAAGVEAEN